MGRVYRKPKEVEQFLIREFVCDALHYTICRAEWCEAPDAILTVQKGRARNHIAIEHTGYFNDTTAGECSPLTPIADFWRSVQTSLAHRIGHRKHLADLTGRVWLNPKHFADRRPDPMTQEKLSRDFAEDLVDFLESHAIADSARFPAHSAHARGTEFSDFPLLESMVASMSVRRIPGGVLRPLCNWLCENISTGCIGLSLENIRTTVRNKNNKAANYNWRSADEKWLLIVAACGNLSENAGLPQDREWDDSELRALCCESPFDRIYFWERARRWYKALKPSRRIVCPRRAVRRRRGRGSLISPITTTQRFPALAARRPHP